MAFILPAVEAISSLVEHFIPDASQAEKDALTAKLQTDHDTFQLLSAQAAIDAAEAASGSLFTAGWRPAVGWVCAASFAWQFLVAPVVLFIGHCVGHPIALPAFDYASMSNVLMGMLGLGAMRTYEKKQGVQNKH